MSHIKKVAVIATRNEIGSLDRAGVSSEETPLLRGEDEGGEVEGSESTLRDGEGESGSGSEVDDGSANQIVGSGRAFLIALSLWGLIFLQASNMSGITTTQSKIAEDLDAFAEASWFTSAYLIAMSSTSPLAARLAQIFSPRRCILFASFLFAVGGIVTSQAQHLKVFLLGRVISGLGASGIMTISFILVLELSSKKRRGLFIGLLNTGFTIGVSFGAVIFGALLASMGWRFLFWAQAPFAIIFGTGIFFGIPTTFTSGHKGADDGNSVKSKLVRIDYLGAVLLTSSICLFLFGLSSAKILYVPIGVSFIVLLVFIFVETRVAAEPIIPVTVLKSRGMLLSCIAQLGIMAARWMVLFYTPAYAIAVRGWSPASAGAILVPTNAGFAIGGILAGWLHIRRTGSFYMASLLSYGTFAATLLVLSQISVPETPTPWYLVSVFFNGLATGAALNYTLAHLLHLTPPSTHFVTTALLTTFRGFAGSFGSAIGGGLFLRVLKSGLEKGFKKHGGLEGRKLLIRKLLGSPALVQSLDGIERTVAIRSYVGALKGLFMAGVGLAVAMVIIQAGTGWRAGIEPYDTDGEQVRNGRPVEDEEWEEGMEQGV